MGEFVCGDGSSEHDQRAEHEHLAVVPARQQGSETRGAHGIN
jgi:hypothetical protein